jgi:hypothetical protein
MNADAIDPPDAPPDEAAPACAVHVDAEATGTCARCGSFACPQCVAMEDGERVWCTSCVLAYRRPFRPRHIGWISFLFGFPSGAVLHAINARRFGQPGRTALAAAGVCLLFLTMATVYSSVPEGGSRAVAMALNIAFAGYYGAARKKELGAYEKAGGRPGSGWQAAGIGLGALVALLLIVMTAAVVYVTVQWERAEAAVDRGDYDEAEEIYASECEAGEPAACRSRGWIREQRGDDEGARRQYERACRGDDPGGCNNLGVLVEEGRGGGPPDAERALRLFRQACQGGDSYGCDNASAYEE